MVLLRAGVMIVIIALVDWRVNVNMSFGFLYLFPMLMMGGVLDRWQIALVALLCTVLGELFDPFPFDVPEGLPRVILVFAAYFGTGLFIYELTKNRRLTMRHVSDIEREIELRREAEEQLTFLIESSPAAILTLDSKGEVLIANEAAHHLFGFETETLRGSVISSYLPALATVPFLNRDAPVFRTKMECHAQRRDGEVFLANIWFSAYRTMSGPRLAAVVVDASEELRSREECSLQQLLDGSRILVGAVCHEIRNICSAIAVVHANLGRGSGLKASEDFEALGTLVDTLRQLASWELRNAAREDMDGVDVSAILDELRIVIEPAFRESEITLRWEIQPNLPLVCGDRNSLLQAFLNLTRNSRRAVEGRSQRQLLITAREERLRVVVRLHDSGPGVTDPQALFQPFQRGAKATGLGLYLSRAFVRAFKGELRYEPQVEGCCFRLELMPIAQIEAALYEQQHDEQNPVTGGGRPHSVSGEPEPAARI